MNMFDLETQMLLLDGVNGAAGFAVNWLLQSTLLISIGLIVGALLRPRGSAVQSLVYRTTLIAVLVCPLATMALASAGFSGWSVTMPETWAMATPAPTVETESVPEIVAEVVQSNTVPESNSIPVDNSNFPAQALSAPTEPMQIFPATASSDQPTPVVEPLVEPTEVPEIAVVPVADPIFTIRAFGILACLAVVIWCLVAFTLSMRLTSAWWKLWRLKRSATKVEPELHLACEQLSVRMNVTAPDVYRSPFLPSPCLAGLRNPSILLPEDDCQLSMQDVLIHELAHLRRHDCHWNLLRQIATSVFFFQPLLWVLSRKLEVSAEEVCDDFVVQYGGNPAEYANRLVGIAELSTAPIAAAGVGVVSLGSMLTQRVTRILDTSRTLSTRVNNLILAIVLVGGLLGTGMTGLLGLNSAAPKDVIVTLDDEDQSDEFGRYAGKVVAPDGQPAANAEIYIVGSVTGEDGSETPTWKSLATTDAEGAFDFSINERDDIENPGDIFAVKEGFGFASMSSALFQTSGESLNTLREKLDTVNKWDRANYQRILDRVGQPLQLTSDNLVTGHIVDIEGQPVVGATLTLAELHSSANNDLSAWREAAAAPDADYYSALRKTPESVYGSALLSLVQPVVTDTKGKFTIAGIGDGRIARLLVEGKTIASEKIFVRSEPGEIIELLEQRSFSKKKKFTYYPNKLSFIASPTAPITGTVRDAESKEPLAGVTIKSQKRHGNSLNGLGADFVRTVTDKDGKYRLVGMPIGNDNRIAAIAPNGDVAYLATSRNASITSPGKEVEIDFDLRRGVWVEGQVTNRATGKGLSGTLACYVPPENPNYDVVGIMNVDQRDQMRADKNGNYRIAAMPGLGYVTFNVDDHQDYPRATSILKADGSREAVTSQMITTAPSVLLPQNSHFIAEINPTAGTDRVELNLQLDGGVRLTGQVVDPAGKPIKEFNYAGRLGGTFAASWDSVEDGKIDIVGYDQSPGRKIYVATKDLKFAGMTELKGKQDGKVVVRLQSAGTASGRLVNDDGDPIEGMRLWHVTPAVEPDAAQFSVPPLPPNVGHSSNALYETDSEGRFEIDGLVPGVDYFLKAFDRVEPGQRQMKGGAFESSFSVKSGESKDLGDVKLADEAKIQAMLLKETSSSQIDSSKDKSQSVDYRGIVTDEKDRPIGGASIEILGKFTTAAGKAPIGKTTSGPDGEFSFTIDKSKFPDFQTEFVNRGVVASKEGYAVGWWSRDESKPDENPKMILVTDDTPINGRLVDLEGKPLAGVSVRVENIMAAKNQNLVPWLAALEGGQIFWEAINEHAAKRGPYSPPGFAKDFKTDSNGNFSITGVGKDRWINVILEGPTIAYTRATIVTRKMKSIVANDGVPNPEWSRKYTVHGADCVIAVPPSQPVTGIVKDAKTGEPMPDVAIESYRMTERGMSAGREIRVKTDEDGRYTLTGLPKGAGSQIMAVPNDDQPYLMRVFDVPNPTGMNPIDLDLELNKGVWITGNLTNNSTGKNLEIKDEAYVYYFPYLSNPFAQATPEYDRQNFDGYQQRYKVAADGSYRLVGLPGKAIVGAMVGREPYPQGQGFDNIKGADKRGWFPTFRVGIGPGNKWPTIMREVDIAETVDSVELDFQLDAGKEIAIEMTDPDGEALKGVQVNGLGQGKWWPTISTSSFDAVAFKPGEKRTMLFHHPERKLGKVERVTAGDDADQKLSVQLQPLVTIRGRLVDKDDQPVSGARIRIEPLPNEEFSPNLKKNVSTDADGRFEHSKVLPGSKYAVMAEHGMMGFSAVASNLAIEPGETIDLGTVNVSKKDRPKPIRTAADGQKISRGASKRSNSQADEDNAKQKVAEAVTVRATITLPDGSPAEQTHVVLSGFSKIDKADVLASGITDSNGNCTLTIKDELGSDQGTITLSAKREGLAVSWKTLSRSKLKDDQPFEISLLEQGVVKGRLVDIDGQPAAGEKLQVQMIINPDPPSGSFDVVIGFEDAPQAWIPPVTTDQDGRFETTGVPGGYGVRLDLVDSEKFATQNIDLTSKQTDEETLVTLSPAKVITGKVTYEDTNEPVANAKISIWASQEPHGSIQSVTGNTDANGEYRLLPKPGTRFGVSAFPPSGVPYMGREAEELKWENADPTRNVDIQLPRVRLVKGRVIEKGTGNPVADATITLESSEKKAPKNVITGWQAVRKTDSDGKFAYAVPAGHCTLVVRKKDSNYVLQTMDSFKMTTDKSGGSRFYANAFHKIEVEKGTDTIDAEIEVLPGKTVHGVIVDEDGNSIEKAVILTRLKSWDLSGGWRGDSQSVTGGKFELTGLEPDESYKVHFLDAKRKLGATIELKATDEEVKVVLQPCGSASAQFIVEDDANRETIKKWGGPPLYFVLSPGVAKFDFKAMQRGKLAADSDFNANVDQVNYGFGKGELKLDSEFRIAYPALIPGATYRIQTAFDPSLGFQNSLAYKEFVVKPGENLDLGKFTPKFKD